MRKYALCCIKPSERGFTLVEVLIAISILTFGLLAVATMQISAIRGNYFSGNVTEGTTWAVDQAEKLIQKGLMNYNDPELKDKDSDGTAGLGHQTEPSADYHKNYGAYDVYWNVANDALLDATKTIHVIVIWGDHGKMKQVSVQGIIPEII